MIGAYSPSVLGPRRDGVSVPRIWITVAVSILLHALLLWQALPQQQKAPTDERGKGGETKGSLSVRIAPPPRAAAPPAPPPLPPPPRVAERPRPAPPPKSAPRAPSQQARPKPAERLPPPVIAMRKPAVEAPPRSVVPERAVQPPPQRAPAEDMAALLESRRRARSESPAQPVEAPPAPPAPSGESANERANRIAAMNLGTYRTPTFGERMPGGGVFTMRYRSYDYAEFLFYGWNKDIKRNTAQVIEVRKGNESDIRIAVVRRMIQIIRDYEQGDFTWESPRLGRVVTKSARPRDQGDLEAFLMQEFFGDDRRR